jgi:DNA-binding transcriptional LysR family regulator
MDLKLIRPFCVLLEERHVSHAAERCGVSQPTMSRLLDRMRVTFNDELLVRNGRQFETTPRAKRLLTELREVLERLDTIVTGDPFAPERCDTMFRLATTDYASAVLVPAVLSDLQTLAPNSALEISAWNDRAFDELTTGRVDAAIGPSIGAREELRYKKLFDDDYVCMVATGHPLGVGRTKLATYLAYPHVVIDVARGLQPAIDQPLANLGLGRRVGYRTPFLSSAIFAVERTSMILTVPRRLAACFAMTARVCRVAAPRELSSFAYYLVWHKRLDSSAPHAWLRGRIHALAETARTDQGSPSPVNATIRAPIRS